MKHAFLVRGSLKKTPFFYVVFGVIKFLVLFKRDRFMVRSHLGMAICWKFSEIVLSSRLAIVFCYLC